MRANRRFVRISPKKVNVVAGLVRGKKATDALIMLKAMNKKAATDVYKTIKSAVAAATTQYNHDENKLVIAKLLVLDGPILKRINPVSRGRAFKILKRMSHISVELGV